MDGSMGRSSTSNSVAGFATGRAPDPTQHPIHPHYSVWLWMIGCDSRSLFTGESSCPTFIPVATIFGGYISQLRGEKKYYYDIICTTDGPAIISKKYTPDKKRRRKVITPWAETETDVSTPLSACTASPD